MKPDHGLNEACLRLERSTFQASTDIRSQPDSDLNVVLRWLK